MKKNDNLKRSGFHSIESIIKNNPHKIKKLFLPSSRDDKRINSLIKMANKNDISFEIIMSEYKGHIKDILKNQNFSNYFSCCIIGGDGSFHEAINGYMSRNNQENVPLSLVPAGSGNSLARDLDIIDYKSALAKIIRKQTKSRKTGFQADEKEDEGQSCDD